MVLDFQRKPRAKARRKLRGTKSARASLDIPFLWGRKGEGVALFLMRSEGWRTLQKTHATETGCASKAGSLAHSLEGCLLSCSNLQDPMWCTRKKPCVRESPRGRLKCGVWVTGEKAPISASFLAGGDMGSP